MAEDVGFDSQVAAKMVEELRSGFRKGRTAEYEWRVTQLKGLVRMIDERETEIVDALDKDLKKPKMESFLHEVCLCFYFFSLSGLVFSLSRLGFFFLI